LFKVIGCKIKGRNSQTKMTDMHYPVPKLMI
jgi:hypothetical protein